MKNLLIITQKVNANDQLLGFFIDWIKLLAEKFEKVTVICLEKGMFDLPENVRIISLGKEQNNFQFSRLRFASDRQVSGQAIFNFQSIFNIQIFKKLKYLLRFYKHIWRERNNYDAVFVHMNPIWVVLGGFCWKMMGKKNFLWYTSGGVTLKLKIAEKFTDMIFTASKESFRIKSKKIIVTGHGIDTELFKPVRDVGSVGNDGDIRDVRNVNNSNKQNDPTSEAVKQLDQVQRRSNGSNNSIKILSVGRIAPVKNYEILIDAVKILKDKGKEVSVTMIGEAPLEKDKEYEKNLKLLITNYQLQSHFNFVGKVDHKNLPAYYQSHDLFIHLSKTGSLDKTILEAIACGINVLSSNDASRSFLPPELIFREDDTKDLVSKIESISQKNFGSQLRQYVIKNHNLNNLIEKISVEIVKKYHA